MHERVGIENEILMAQNIASYWGIVPMGGYVPEVLINMGSSSVRGRRLCVNTSSVAYLQSKKHNAGSTPASPPPFNVGA